MAYFEGDESQPASPLKRARTMRKPRMSAAEKRAANRTARCRTARLAEKERRKKEERSECKDPQQDSLWPDILQFMPDNCSSTSTLHEATLTNPAPGASSPITSHPCVSLTASLSDASPCVAPFIPSSSPSSSSSSTASCLTARSEWSSTSSTLTLGDGAMTEDLEHQAYIIESQRKLAELEKDKPLWVEGAKKRLAEEVREKAVMEEKAAQCQMERGAELEH